ncbi:hypothetical protein STRTUCAR8_08627 [Streptomyces turgidiscabies Car8]|uniref:Uncharacterized protein n=2 Tax=Streptomyces turgidiscabies TaxID=85558 RepID=L7FAF5_STRT8|nr:hypothetical protein STRTUCAR8_08627 [Streptomyces turgidiscabies Car8]
MQAGVAVLSAVFVGAVLLVRWALTPVRDAGPPDVDHDTVVTPIDDVMGLWEREQEPVYRIALERAQGGRTWTP